jgi:hypothetical protein
LNQSLENVLEFIHLTCHFRKSICRELQTEIHQIKEYKFDCDYSFAMLLKIITSIEISTRQYLDWMNGLFGTCIGNTYYLCHIQLIDNLCTLFQYEHEK